MLQVRLAHKKEKVSGSADLERCVPSVPSLIAVAHPRCHCRRQLDVKWFDTWVKAWSKPYLTPAGLHELWRAIPHDQKERFEPLRDEMRTAFAREEDMDAQARAPATHALCGCGSHCIRARSPPSR